MIKSVIRSTGFALGLRMFCFVLTSYDLSVCTLCVILTIYHTCDMSVLSLGCRVVGPTGPIRIALLSCLLRLDQMWHFPWEDLVLLHAAGYRGSISSLGQALQQLLFQNRQIMAVYPTFK